MPTGGYVTGRRDQQGGSKLPLIQTKFEALRIAQIDFARFDPDYYCTLTVISSANVTYDMSI